MNRAIFLILTLLITVVGCVSTISEQKQSPSIEDELREETNLKRINSDLENEIEYLIQENKRLESENEELKQIPQATATPKDIPTEESSREGYIDITINKFWGYTECDVYGAQNFCTKLDVAINNTGTDSIYFDPYRDTWLLDDSLVQYNLVRTGGDSEFRSGKIYPNTVKRGYLYYYPAVPLKSKNITFYAGINGKGIKKVITHW
ncbi:MAG: DUF4352 domain-containing protein [Candidatus Hydrothermarchaeaceae archaeon]